MKTWGICLLLLIVLVSGCTTTPDGNQPNACSNGVMITDYNVLPSNQLYKGDSASVIFTLENKGDRAASNVRVKVFDPNGFKIISTKCEQTSVSADECVFKKLDSDRDCIGEVGNVYIEMEAPELEGPRTVSFSVDYDYSGSRSLSFNIWKRTSKNQWGKKKIGTTYGPIGININSNFIVARSSGSGEWVVENQKFPLEITTIDNGGSGIEIGNVSIDKENFKIRFFNLHPDPEKADECHIERKGDYYIPKEDVKVPTEKPIKCSMVAGPIDEEWGIGIINIDYSYSYKFIKKQDFNVQKED